MKTNGHGFVIDLHKITVNNTHFEHRLGIDEKKFSEIER